MNEPLEQIALHYRDDIIWLAYRKSGEGREETAYTEGWNFEGETGSARYALLRKVLDSQFGVDRRNPLVFSKYLGVTQVFLDGAYYLRLNRDTAGGFQEGDKAIILEFFSSYGIDCTEIDAPWERYQTVNDRWKKAMGEDIGEDEPGGVRALSVMSAGIREQSAN